MPHCMVCATPGLALKSVRFLVMNDDCFPVQHQPIDLCNGSTLVGHHLNHYVICNNFGFGRVIHPSMRTWFQSVKRLIVCSFYKITQFRGSPTPTPPMAPDVCGSSIWNFGHVALLVPGIWWWLLDFWKICAASSLFNSFFYLVLVLVMRLL
jgi:hypothetical protein